MSIYKATMIGATPVCPMTEFEDCLAFISFIAIYGTRFAHYYFSSPEVAPVSSVALVVLANASLGGNVTRIARVHTNAQ